MSPSNGLQNGDNNGGVGGGNGLSYIEHYVSKFDTLAGVAIKYCVEAADVKRMNGLATDLQMFALQMLRIPLPGRHPPSPVLSEPAKLRENSSERGLKPPKQKISPAMTILQKYYGLESSSSRDTSGETEMVIYTSTTSDHSRDEWLPKPSPIPNHHSKTYLQRLHPNYRDAIYILGLHDLQEPNVQDGSMRDSIEDGIHILEIDQTKALQM